MDTIRDRVVLLTGASRGMGRVFALAFARAGADLVLVARDAAGLEACAAEVRALGRVAHVLPADLGDTASLGALAARAIEVAGRVDVVVHNAGIEPFIRFEEIEPASLEQVIAVNFTAPAVLTRALVPHMLTRGSGHVVFLGSTSSLFAAPYAALYGATKSAVSGLSRSLSAEYAGRGVGFSVIQPGFVVGTGMFADVVEGKGLTPPATIGSTTAEAVVAATLDAILRDRADVIVNSVPVGGGAGLARMLPSVGMAFMRSAVAPFMAKLADASKR
jgi:short-subunit dehydrogenase